MTGLLQLHDFSLAWTFLIAISADFSDCSPPNSFLLAKYFSSSSSIPLFPSSQLSNQLTTPVHCFKPALNSAFHNFSLCSNFSACLSRRLRLKVAKCSADLLRFQDRKVWALEDCPYRLQFHQTLPASPFSSQLNDWNLPSLVTPRLELQSLFTKPSRPIRLFSPISQPNWPVQPTFSRLQSTQWPEISPSPATPRLVHDPKIIQPRFTRPTSQNPDRSAQPTKPVNPANSSRLNDRNQPSQPTSPVSTNWKKFPKFLQNV